ncbi:RNA polymerase sporulation sigma factor SigF [Paenalkalicoccus suaedae]|uniref:RNA polymerase sigma factor n=1 Tax=Paenalkalicoccus suaedae TaxID=2592382 RepID=A0A859FDU7_9BACI|nr:RNA polymerase sporulation sigma factor SigF [Paenalkalicoccus suaedae]QKS71031.1 RNA polymerase sporulation sigma factor SigF [Paenalkalicoccus suaedae]
MATHLEDKEVKELLVKAQSGDVPARHKIVKHNTRLVWSVVQRFSNRGYEQEDLFQIGCIGLMKSIDKFDLSYDVKFSTYAVPMIIGEIQRFLRDDGAVKVSRSIKELSNQVRKTSEQLMKELGRVPTVKEIASFLELSPEEVVFAQDASRQLASIHETIYENDGEPITILDQMADEPDRYWFDKLALREEMKHLDERSRIIIMLRYYKDQTQSQVAARLGISQVQVSRLEKKILETLKEKLEQTS